MEEEKPRITKEQFEKLEKLLLDVNPLDIKRKTGIIDGISYICNLRPFEVTVRKTSSGRDSFAYNISVECYLVEDSPNFFRSRSINMYSDEYDPEEYNIESLHKKLEERYYEARTEEANFQRFCKLLED